MLVGRRKERAGSESIEIIVGITYCRPRRIPRALYFSRLVLELYEADEPNSPRDQPLPYADRGGRRRLFALAVVVI
jgi:hypothetical protein